MRVGETHRPPLFATTRAIPSHGSATRAQRSEPDGSSPAGADTLHPMAKLLDKRLIFVTGKGGVGKSTVAAALGMVAARGGRRTIIAEVAYQDRVARAFHSEDSHAREVRLTDGLY